MDFKERFKGRTTTMKKEGFIDTFEAPNNPVTKSQTTFQPYSSSKMASAATTSFTNNNVTNSRQFNPQPAENRQPPYPITSYSEAKGPVNNSYPNQGGLTHNGGGFNQNPAIKNPFLVNNPYTSLDMQDHQMNQGNMMRDSRQENQTFINQRMTQQNTHINGFNPESFYNQHSQYKNSNNGNFVSNSAATTGMMNYAQINNNQMMKKNFENLTQQSKQKRMAEDGLRGLENPNMRYQVPNNRYEGYDPTISGYSNLINKPPLPMQGYNGQRDSYSNPAPNYNLESNAFSHMPGNITQHVERGRQLDGRNQFPSNASPDFNKTGSYSNASYKPYNLKDYKEIKTKSPVKLGGLGPNTNTEWQKVKEKRDKMLEFSENVKLFNAQRASSDAEYMIQSRKEKEPSKREVALQFAKNVPKPKQKRDDSPEEKSPSLRVKKAESDVTYNHTNYNKNAASQNSINYNYNAVSSNYNHNAVSQNYNNNASSSNYTPQNDDLAEFERKHNHYVAELEKIK